MIFRGRMGLCALFGVIAGMVGGLAWSFAPSGGAKVSETAKLIPANAVLYVGLDGGMAHQEAFAQTAAHDALYKSGLVDGLKKALARAKEQATAAGADQAAVASAMMLSEHVLNHGLSLAVAIDSNRQQGPPTAYAVLVLPGAIDLLPQIEGALKGLMQDHVPLKTSSQHGREVTSGTIPDTPGVTVGWWVEGKSHLVLAVGINGVESALSVADGSLPNVTTNSLYQKYSRSENFEQSALSFLDFAALRKIFGDLPLPPLPDGRAISINELLKPFGLDGLDAVVAQSGFKGRSCWAQTRMETHGTRSALLSLVDQKPFKLEDLPPLPEQLMNMVAVSVDGGKIYDTILGLVRDAVKTFHPQESGNIDQGLAAAERELGFKLKDDLWGTISGVACLWVDGAGGQSLNSLGATIQLKDGARLQKTLTSLFDRISEESRGAATFEKSNKVGRDMRILRIREFAFVSPTFCVDQGRLYIGIMPQAVESALLRADGKLPSWKPSEDHLAAFQELPQEFTSISIGDTQAAYRQLIGAAPLLIGAVNTALAQSPNPNLKSPLKAEDLPPADLVAQPLFPNISVTTVDGNGVSGTTRSSMPSMDVGVGVAVVAVSAALLLPAVQQAREAARRTQSRNNLKQIMLALHNYHDTFGQFPSGTVPNEKLKPEERLSWLVSILPYLDQTPLYNQFDMDAGWKEQPNSKLLMTSLTIYMNPSATDGKKEYAQTHYVGIAGLGKDGPTLPVTDPKAGVFAYNRGTKVRDITDGTSNTLAVTDSSEPGAWGAGGKGTIRPLTTKPYINGPDGIGGPHVGGISAALCDGSVRFISENIDPSILEALVTIRGGEVIGDF